MGEIITTGEKGINITKEIAL